MTDEAELKPWLQHTKHFLPRVLAIGSTCFEFLHGHIDPLPRLPLAVALSDSAAVKYQLALLVIGSLRSAREIAFSSSKLWVQGHFLVASVGFRMLVELNGQLLWSECKVLKPLEAGDADLPFERMKKLLFGAKSAVALAQGEVAPHPLVNVMDFVRAAEAAEPGTMDDYAFLCDSAHPSYLMQSWMLFAGPAHDNWANPAFAAQVSPLLDRTLGIAERAISNMEGAADRIMSAVVPTILTETAAG